MDDKELLKQDISYIKCSIDEIKKSLETKYVTRVEFNPVKSIAFGMVGIILVSVLGSLIALVVNS
jgi:ABC-type phosphate transport system permease subunit